MWVSMCSMWDFFSVVNTTLLHDSRLLEPGDVDPQTWRVTCKLHVDF